MGARIGDIIVLVILAGTLVFFSYFLWVYYPQITGKSVTFFSNESGNYAAITGGSIIEISNGSQFYPNMRYKDKEISYWLEPGCSGEKIQEMKGAFVSLSEKTILRFKEADSKSAEILVYCSELAPDTEEEGHFIAGEGGPSKIVNNSLYSIILLGKISLFREDKCEKPQVALHELLHALGFEHRTNAESILYPVTDCKQELDEDVIDEVNKLYSQEALPDLAFEYARANLSGRYLNFEINVVNKGLADSGAVSIGLYSDNSLIKTFSMDSLDIGMSKTLSVQNLRVDSDITKLIFVVSDGWEISDSNNRMDMVVAS